MRRITREPAANLDLLTLAAANIPIVSKVVEVFTGITGGFSDLVDYLTGQNKVRAATAAKIAEIENRLAVGATSHDDFNRADNPTTIANGWVQGGNGQNLGLRDNAIRLDDNGGIPIGINAGRRYAIDPVKAAGDDVVVSAVVADGPITVAACTTIILRANAALTEFVYANVFGRKVYLGRGSRSGNTWNFPAPGTTEWKANTDIRLAAGATVYGIAVGNRYEVRQGDVTLLDHTDTSGFPVDAAHRTVAVALQTEIIFGQLPHYSWGVTAFAHRPATLADIGALQAAAQAAESAAGDAVDAAEDAQDQATKLRETLAEYMANSDAGENEGTARIERFSTYASGANLGANWSVLPSPGVLGIQSGRVGVAVTSGTYFTARHVVPMTSNSVYAKAVIAATPEGAAIGQDGPYGGVFCRANDSMTQFVFATAEANSVLLGLGTWTGSGWSFSTWDSESATVKKNDVIGVYAIDNPDGSTTYRATINDIVQCEATNATVAAGEGNRYVGMLFSRTTWFTAPYYSPPFSLFLAADYAPPQYVGVGWSILRTNDAAHSLTGSAEARFPAGIYSATAGPETRNVTPITTNAGEIEIKVSGWYAVDARFSIGLRSTSLPTLSSLIWVSTDKGISWKVIRDGGSNGADMGDGSYSVTIGCECSAVVYLQQGWRIAPGIRRSGAVDIVGDAEGKYTRFSGTLITAVKGAQGQPGPQGRAGIAVQIGEIYTGAPGSLAAIALTENEDGTVQTLDMQIPRGDTGATGPKPTMQIVSSLPATGVVGDIYWIPE